MHGHMLAGSDDHARINFIPTHTCAACKAKYPNNYSLEKHAAKERHKSFLCTCTTGFGRLATLNRHIEAQTSPKHHCTYCDDNKGFAREDKLVDHLRASHKFGDKAIAQFRSQARSQRDGNEYASPAAATTGVALSVSVSAGHDAAPGGILGQAENSAGPSAVPAGIVHGGLADFAMFSAADLQPLGSVQDYSWAGAAVDFAGVDFSGLDFSGVDFSGVYFSGLDFADVDGDLDMAGMDGGL